MLKKGQQVAVYVHFEDEEEPKWIMTKIEKKINNNLYMVHDEYADDPNKERFRVEASNITMFSHPSSGYEPGEHVLARWKNPGDWTTVLYDAEVISVNKGGTVTLLYQGTEDQIVVNTNKITKYPPNFLNEEEEIGEEEEEAKGESEAEEQIENNEKQEEAVQVKSEQSEVNLSEEPEMEAAPPTAVTSSENQEDEEVQNSTPAASSPPQSPQPMPPSSSQEVFIPVQEEVKRTLAFTFDKPEPVESTKIRLIDDNELKSLVKDAPDPEKVTAIEGTPLLDCLEDPELFEQEIKHTTASGMMYRKNMKPHVFKSALMDGQKCGRLGHIIQGWVDSQ